MMSLLRESAARNIYCHPTYLEEMYIRDFNKTRPLPNTDTGKPDKKAFIDHFLTKSPYADDVEVRVIQENLARFNVVVVIYNPSSSQQFHFYNGIVPETLESLIVLKLHHEHYEPIIFHVDGKWQHTIPIGMKDSPTYGKLFKSIANMWTGFGMKVFPDSTRRIKQKIAQLEDEDAEEVEQYFEQEKARAIENFKKIMAAERELVLEDGTSMDTPPIAPVSPWWRRPVSSMEDQDP